MSYILDALKKIEHEKDRKKQSGERFNISGDLFREVKQQPSESGIWKIVPIVVVVAIVACGATWFVLKCVARKSTTAERPAKPQVVVPQPSVVLPVPAPVQSPPTTVVAPAAPPVISSQSVQKNSETVADDNSFGRSAKRFEKQPKSLSPISKQPAQVVPAPVDIKLSGIAWQEDRTARRAVINGFLLKEGAVVSGAKITDIKTDKVRFMSTTGVFEIKLDAVLSEEVRK